MSTSSSLLSSLSNDDMQVYGPAHLRDLKLILTTESNSTDTKTSTFVYHIHHAILAHTCEYFNSITQNQTNDVIELPSPFTVAGYTVTPQDLQIFLLHIYERGPVSIDDIDGVLALPFYYDCASVRSECDELLTSTVQTLGAGQVQAQNQRHQPQQPLQFQQHLQQQQLYEQPQITTSTRRVGNNQNTTETCSGLNLLRHLVRAVRFHLPKLESTCISFIAQHYILQPRSRTCQHTYDVITSVPEFKQLTAETSQKMCMAMCIQAQLQQPVEWK